MNRNRRLVEMALGKATPCRRSLEFNKENTASAALTSRRSLQPATMPISEIDKALGLHFSNNKSPLKEANLVSRHDFPDYTSESPKALEVLRAVDPVTLELNMNFPWTNSPIQNNDVFLPSHDTLPSREIDEEPDMETQIQNFLHTPSQSSDFLHSHQILTPVSSFDDAHSLHDNQSEFLNTPPMSGPFQLTPLQSGHFQLTPVSSYDDDQGLHDDQSDFKHSSPQSQLTPVSSMEGVNVLHDQSAASLTPAQGLHDDQSDFIQSSPQSQLTSVSSMHPVEILDGAVTTQSEVYLLTPVSSMECALNLDGVDQADDFAVTQGPNQTEHLSQSADILVGPEVPSTDPVEQVMEGDEISPFGPQQKPLSKKTVKENNRRKRSLGEEYTNSNGLLVPAKKPREYTCKCQFSSCSALTLEQIATLNSSYWNLGDYSRQRDYLLKCVKSVPVKRHKTNAIKPRSTVYSYVFRVQDEDDKETDITVCRGKFLAVLNIGKKTLVHAKATAENGFAKPDQRGKKAPKHKLKPEQLAAVTEHIASFPKVESHYCRKSSSLEYLDHLLSISLMYKLFKFQHSNDGLMVGYESYRRIFHSEFHLSFHKPKKDQCSTCAIYNNLSDEEKENKKEAQERHLRNKELARAMKAQHKERAIADHTFKSFTFDLQSVLYAPCSEVSSFYYKRKFNSYNFTTYDQATRDGQCFFWNETDGEKGSNEVGTALWDLLTNLPATVNEVSLISDCCGGQNRNRFIASLCLHAVRTLSLERIDHLFLESGHTHMEVDSMHSNIERAKKGRSIYAPSEWLSILRSARNFSTTKDPEPLQIRPYSVKVLTYEKFLDIKDLRKVVILSPLEKNSQKEQVNWMLIKRLRYEKQHPEAIFYRYDYDSEDFKKMNAPAPRPAVLSTLRKKGRPKKQSGQTAPPATPVLHYEMKRAYEGLIPISEKKKKDLVKLCNEGLIPNEFHQFYMDLPAVASKKDRLPLPDITEEDEDGPAALPTSMEFADEDNEIDSSDSED